MYATAHISVEAELTRQNEKWGEQNHDPLKWGAILGEEVGEVHKAVLDGDKINYRDELVQVAAVAIQAVACLDRAQGR